MMNHMRTKKKRMEMGMDGGPYKYSATKKNISGRNIYSVVASYLYVWILIDIDIR